MIKKHIVENLVLWYSTETKTLYLTRHHAEQAEAALKASNSQVESKYAMIRSYINRIIEVETTYQTCRDTLKLKDKFLTDSYEAAITELIDAIITVANSKCDNFSTTELVDLRAKSKATRANVKRKATCRKLNNVSKNEAQSGKGKQCKCGGYTDENS